MHILKPFNHQIVVFVVAIILLRLKDATSIFIPFSSNPNDIQFLLYTNGVGGQQSQELVLGNIESILDSNFRSDIPIVVMIHGFWCNRNTNFPSKVRNAYLDAIPLIQNYIVVDWGPLSQADTLDIFENIVYPLVYPMIVGKNVPIVSRRVAAFIQFLVDNNQTDLARVHIVGHSLGAHIAGFVGQLLQDSNSEAKKVARISGLDPAGPLFDTALIIQRNLRKSDAQFVDVYHTAMGTRGDSTVDGHVDFYPNGGVVQPSCPQDLNLAPSVDPFGKGSCSHEFVVDIYAATIKKSFTACKCNLNMNGDQLENCMQDCPDPILAGEKCPNVAQGLYYFQTTENP